jgi:hypothetical protein
VIHQICVILQEWDNLASEFTPTLHFAKIGFVNVIVKDFLPKPLNKHQQYIKVMRNSVCVYIYIYIYIVCVCVCVYIYSPGGDRGIRIVPP